MKKPEHGNEQPVPPGQVPGHGATRREPGELHQPYLHHLVPAVRAPAMCLSGLDGQIRPGGAEGLYVQDLRALSKLVATVNGAEPVLLGNEVTNGPHNRFTSVVVGLGEHGPDPAVVLVMERVVQPAGMVEKLTFRSYAASPIGCRVEVSIECDLAPMEMVKAGRQVPTLVPLLRGKGLEWEASGLCTVRAVGIPVPSEAEPLNGVLSWDLALASRESSSISIEISLEGAGGEPLRSPVAGVAAKTHQGEQAFEVVAADQRLAKFVDRSLADLASLRMALADEPADEFMAAGAPWYLTLFGRDSLWTARMLLPLGTELALGTLRALARYQGQRSDAKTGQEPGKILHELRRSPEGGPPPGQPGGRDLRLPPVYYGTVDATLLWVCLLNEAWKWGAPAAEIEQLLPAMQGCLAWLGSASRSSDGFVRYVGTSGGGLANQGWKDSSDAIQFRNGHLARPPIALCEVQGYAYQAAVAGAELLDAFGLDGADKWRAFATGLAERFHRSFWLDDDQGPYPAIALDADGTPVDSASSNIGHLLGSGFLGATESDAVARRLNCAELNSGFGLRTLATSSAGFNPLSYHCGSVWPHDTAIAVLGLARTGGEAASAAATALIDGLLSAAEGFEYRIPELYAGDKRRGNEGASPYPASCRPQAWAAGGSLAVVAALLGMAPDVPAGRMALRPLPSPVGLSKAVGLRLAGKNVSVELRPEGPVVTGAPDGVVIETGLELGHGKIPR